MRWQLTTSSKACTTSPVAHTAMMTNVKFVVVLAIATAAVVTVVHSQFADSFVASRDVPQIAYSKGPVANRVSELNAQLSDGRVRLAFDGRSGYLRSVLDALQVPVESQIATFAKNSFQAELIDRRNPRGLYFSDDVAVGWVRGADLLEVAVHDPKQGGIFYTLEQKRASRPELKREDGCLACHLSW